MICLVFVFKKDKSEQEVVPYTQPHASGDLSEHINQGSETMAGFIGPEFKAFVEREIGRNEEEKNASQKTRNAARDLQQRNLFKFLSHGFVSNEDENLQKAVESMDDVLDKYHTKKNDAPEKLASNSKEIQELLRESNKKGGKSLGGSNTEILKSLKNIEKYTIINANLLGMLIRGKTDTKNKRNAIGRRLFPGSKSRNKFSENDLHDAGGLGDSDHAGGGSGFLPAFLGSEMGSNHIGHRIGNALASFGGAIGRTLITAAPGIGLAAGGALLGYLAVKGLGDSDKAKERTKQLDDTKKQQIAGELKVSDMPTSVQNIFSSGEASYDQFKKLGSPEEQKKYLQSYGVKNDDIEKSIKQPEKLNTYNEQGKKHSFTPRIPKMDRLTNPGSTQPTSYTQLSLSGNDVTTSSQRTSTPMPDDGPISKFNPSANFDQKAPQVLQNLMSDFSLTQEQAAGILGNLGHESQGFKTLQEINPVGGGAGGYGWAQWTGPRRKEFLSWAKANNLDPASDEANYGFLKHELNGSESGAIAAIKKTDNVKDATVAFERAYERSGVTAYSSRQAYAARALQALGSPQTASSQATAGSVVAQTVPDKKTGENIAKASSDNASLKSAASTPTVNVTSPSQPATPSVSASHQTTGTTSARNDEPTLLQALRGDLAFS
jgi:hypothetical protein